MNDDHPRRGQQTPPEKSGIRLLADPVIDQIAAGEVVERPASVVKELVENALDADASRVEVLARDGGRGLVCVTDDGWGMNAADAALALQRHATSKLSSAQDLEQIRSFGFRGEALPSIASVSRFRLRTRRRGGPIEAHELRLDFGELEVARSAGGPEGTRIEVGDLFGNVPARRKFLKRPATEWSHIATWMSRMALALPEVHFEMQHDERRPTVWPATTDRLERIAAVLSEEDAAALAAARIEEGGLQAELYVSVPERTRTNAEGLHLFVNGRAVRDRLLRHALLEPCRDWLPRGRFPTALLFLEVPPATVDVNVHPQKWEVRFEDPQAVHRLVRHAVRRAIESRRWLGGGAPTAAGAAGAAGAEAQVADGAGRFEPGRPAGGMQAGSGAWTFRAAAGDANETATPNDASSRRIRFAELRPLGQLLASYLLLEGEGGLVVVDQHAAHERVLYEGLRAQALGAGIESQPLLWATPVALEAGALQALAEQDSVVSRLGFDVDAFGEREAIVRAVPSLLADRAPEQLVRDLAAGLAEAVDARGAEDEAGADALRLLPALDRIFATMACHSARRFGDALPDDEQSAILRGLDAIPWAPTCPHGRPVAIALDQGELERRFGRH